MRERLIILFSTIVSTVSPPKPVPDIALAAGADTTSTFSITFFTSILSISNSTTTPISTTSTDLGAPPACEFNIEGKAPSKSQDAF